jgi:hypothetical protein
MKTTIALVLVCYLTTVFADVSVTISTPFSITSTGPNSIDFPETSRDVVSAAYAISVNATIPFTYVLVKDVIIAFSEDLADSSVSHPSYSIILDCRAIQPVLILN